MPTGGIQGIYCTQKSDPEVKQQSDTFFTAGWVSGHQKKTQVVDIYMTILVSIPFRVPVIPNL